MNSVKPIPIGFTFSYAVDQKCLNSAILLKWSKGFETGAATEDPVIGCDVCCLLAVALNRAKIPAKVVAVLNDTVS